MNQFIQKHKKKVIGVDPLSWISEKEKNKSIKIEDIVGKTRPKLSTIKIMKELIEKHVDWQKILEILKS